MLVPVSPSGTGYTLSRLIRSAWAASASRNVVIVSRRASTPNTSERRRDAWHDAIVGGELQHACRDR